MNRVQTFSASVACVTDLTHDVRQLDLRLVNPPEIGFAPGQFVSFHVERSGAPFGVTRAYSIASPPSRSGAIQLVLNRVPGGFGSGYLFGLREGDPTRFHGPSGTFTLGASGRNLLFVATGTGIAPFRSMLWSLVDADPERSVTLFWGLRSERDLYYQDELSRLREQLRHFSFVTTLSQPKESWPGSVGRVTPLVDARITSVENLDVFLCGSSAMIADVTTVIRRKGICSIHHEQYYNDRIRDAERSMVAHRAI